MSSLARLRGGSWSEYYSQIHIVAVREGCQETMATNQGRFSRLVAENESRRHAPKEAQSLSLTSDYLLEY